MEILSLVLHNFVKSRLGADGESCAFVTGSIIQSTKRIPTNVAKQEIMIMLVLLVLLVYPAADSTPRTANNFLHGVKASIMSKMSLVVRV